MSDIKYLKGAQRLRTMRPGTFQYQDTTADTLFHYKFNYGDWEPLSYGGTPFDGIRDFSSNNFHLKALPSYYYGTWEFGKQAPADFTSTARVYCDPYGPAGISTDIPGYEPQVVIAADESFVFSTVFMLPTSPPMWSSGFLMPFWLGVYSVGTEFAFHYSYPNDMTFIIEKFEQFDASFALVATMQVKYENVIKDLTVGKWHRVTLVADRNSLTHPYIVIDKKKYNGVLQSWYPATDVTKISDFGEIALATRIGLGSYGVFTHGSEDIYLGEMWMSKGTSYRQN